ncbi:hypothetical protein ACQX0N_00410 [Clostridium tepidum]|jgi:hypothetical protein|uniref:Uncharacterized protein n=1 Tax=Clostridium tepidum TaxID=1962263 RepID=A0A1S9I1Y6_9CLOT|nr:hypothetical protein [Clostridium tepidum]MCR1934815.1 hypothetical protein [Clostridium tepidum]MDU6878350.1 hypothetical protein [Clostridium botulinum]OOO62138.1 hypothetical protein BS637_08410 [Clostridium tepidum]OOO64333.1 hypothetical protein BS638_11040 [Clostridium tepidum]
MWYCKEFILLLVLSILLTLIFVTLIFISRYANKKPYNYKLTIDCMDKDSKECTKVNLYAKNLYLNAH